MTNIILLVSAILPIAVFLFFIFRKDSKKEPGKLLVKSFLWGCAATLPIVLIELLLGLCNIFTSPVLNSFYEAFIVAAFVEEGVKFLVLYLIIWRHKEFDQLYDGIVYAVFVSLGFAVIENLLFVFNTGLVTSIFRAILSVPAHGFFGVIMGYFFALAKFSGFGKTRNYLWLSFLVPWLFHGLYDFALFLIDKSNDIGLVLFLLVALIAVIILLWRTGIRHIKRHYTKDIESGQ